MAAAANTILLCSAVVSQRWDSLSLRARFWCAILIRPRRVQIRPPAKPRQLPLSASIVTMACNSTPRPTPLPISPRPRRRLRVVRKLISLVSWIASTCRPATADAVRSLHPSTRRSTLTLGFARNRPKATSRRRPRPKRRKQTLERNTMHLRSIAPFYRDDDPQTGPKPNFAQTSRHSGLTKVSGIESHGRGPGESTKCTPSHSAAPKAIRCVHPLAQGGGEKRAR
jgi:hypothetical protein